MQIHKTTGYVHLGCGQECAVSSVVMFDAANVLRVNVISDSRRIAALDLSPAEALQLATDLINTAKITLTED